MGLINKVVPADQLDAEVEAWCREILALSPTAIAIAKRSFNADSENIRGISALAFEALALYYDTEEAKEGTNAFLGKAPAEFSRQAGQGAQPVIPGLQNRNARVMAITATNISNPMTIIDNASRDTGVPSQKKPQNTTRGKNIALK